MYFPVFRVFRSGKKYPAKPVIFIKDSAQYSASFIQKLTQKNYAENYKFIDSLLIFDNRDTFKFEQYTKPNRRRLFIGLGYKNTDTMFDIHFNQLNYTDLDVEINILDRNNNNFKHLQKIKGIAELNSDFLKSKMKENAPRTGEIYFSNAFTFTEKNCEYTVFIGNKSANMLGVKFERKCQNKSNNILAVDNPQFEEK